MRARRAGPPGRRRGRRWPPGRSRSCSCPSLPRRRPSRKASRRAAGGRGAPRPRRRGIRPGRSISRPG
ncbi:MAG: hypothetical protein FJY80_05425 [Candidatus Aminicenantes bacterium]|nr:hypothetical protein [Candidatus Aminicenantes bacterium]